MDERAVELGPVGKSDESGTLNLITPASRLAAARLVREGVAVSLSHDADKEKAPDNAKPFVHEMITTSEQPGADIFRDSFSIVHHGIMHTHLDALCHFSYKGSSYNGFSTKEVTSKGAARLSIEAARNGLFARGILIDVPELKGVPYLEPGAAIFPEDLDAWEKKTGLRVKPGDVVLIRTGRWARRVEKGPVVDGGACGPACVERGVAAQARYRRSGQRRVRRRLALAGGGHPAASPYAGDRRDGHPDPRQCRSGGTEPREPQTEALGLPVDGGSVDGAWSHRVGAESIAIF